MMWTRREFATGAAAICGGLLTAQAAGKKAKFELGLASYSLRHLKVPQMIKVLNDAGLKNVALKSFHLPLNADEATIKKVAKTVRDGGLNLYGVGVVYMKNEAAVNNTFEYAKAAGVKVIIGVPAPNLLALTEKKVKEYDIKVAIHNHGPTDKTYSHPQAFYDKIKDMDPRMGVCMDIGHTMRCGIDPSDAALACKDRLHDLHLRDVNVARKEGKGVPFGKGIIDLKKLFKTLVEIEYCGVAAIEDERKNADLKAGTQYLTKLMNELG